MNSQYPQWGQPAQNSESMSPSAAYWGQPAQNQPDLSQNAAFGVNNAYAAPSYAQQPSFNTQSSGFGAQNSSPYAQNANLHAQEARNHAQEFSSHAREPSFPAFESSFGHDGASYQQFVLDQELETQFGKEVLALKTLIESLSNSGPGSAVSNLQGQIKRSSKRLRDVLQQLEETAEELVRQVFRCSRIGLKKLKAILAESGVLIVCCAI